MTDILLQQTLDGGEITAVNGQLSMTQGLETAVFLSLFGGNVNDSGLAADDAKQWWGNVGESDTRRTHRSETQYLLATLPLTLANLQRFEEAANADVAWFTEEIADSIAVAVTMPGLNRIQYNIVIVINGDVTKFSISPSAT